MGRRGTAARRLGDSGAAGDAGGASAGTPGGCQDEWDGTSEGGEGGQIVDTHAQRASYRE